MFAIGGFFLLLFLASLVLTTLGDDIIGEQRVDINTVAEHIRVGDVVEINQRNTIQMILILNNGEKLIYFHQPNTTFTDALAQAGIDSAILSKLKFTVGKPQNAYETAGDILRLIGLGGLFITVIIAYLQRRQVVLIEGNR